MDRSEPARKLRCAQADSRWRCPLWGILIVTLAFWSGLLVKATRQSRDQIDAPSLPRDEIIQQRDSEALRRRKL